MRQSGKEASHARSRSLLDRHLSALRLAIQTTSSEHGHCLDARSRSNYRSAMSAGEARLRVIQQNNRRTASKMCDFPHCMHPYTRDTNQVRIGLVKKRMESYARSTSTHAPNTRKSLSAGSGAARSLRNQRQQWLGYESHAQRRVNIRSAEHADHGWRQRRDGRQQ